MGITQDNLCHPYNILSTTVPSDGMKTNNTQSTVYSSVNSSVSYACAYSSCAHTAMQGVCIHTSSRGAKQTPSQLPRRNRRFVFRPLSNQTGYLVTHIWTQLARPTLQSSTNDCTILYCGGENYTPAQYAALYTTC